MCDVRSAFVPLGWGVERGRGSLGRPVLRRGTTSTMTRWVDARFWYADWAHVS